MYSNSLLAALNARGRSSSLKMITLRVYPHLSSGVVLSDVTADYKVGIVFLTVYSRSSYKPPSRSATYRPTLILKGPQENTGIPRYASVASCDTLMKSDL